MALTSEFSPIETVVQAGNACLLCASGRHFLVKILDVTEDTICTSFAVKDYLVRGMCIDLEFHEEDGYLECRTEVLEEPQHKGDGVLLRRPAESYWNAHRDSNRVATDLTVQVRDKARPRRYDAELVDLGSGGVLIHTRAPLTIPAMTEIALSLPGEPQLTVTGRVVHVGRPQPGEARPLRRYGIRFVDLPSDAYQPITRYITYLLTRPEI